MLCTLLKDVFSNQRKRKGEITDHLEETLSRESNGTLTFRRTTELEQQRNHCDMCTGDAKQEKRSMKEEDKEEVRGKKTEIPNPRRSRT